MKGTFSIKLILVRDYLSCEIDIYLNRNLHSNPILSRSMFRHFIVDYFFYKEVETPRCFFKWISRVWVRILVNQLITTIWTKNHLLRSFFAPLQSLHILSLSLWESQESLSSLSWLMKIWRFGIFLKFNGLKVCYSVPQWQIFSTELYLSLLLITCAPKSFSIYFVYQRLF